MTSLEQKQASKALAQHQMGEDGVAPGQQVHRSCLASQRLRQSSPQTSLHAYSQSLPRKSEPQDQEAVEISQKQTFQRSREKKRYLNEECVSELTNPRNGWTRSTSSHSMR